MSTVLAGRVIDIVADIAGCKAQSLNSSTDLYADLKMDSLDALELLVALEDEFHVDVENDQAEGIRTIADIVSLLTGLIPAPGNR